MYSLIFHKAYGQDISFKLYKLELLQ